jgi:hypothetical protein
MITVKLSADEGRRLEDTFHITPDRRLRDRCEVILIAARGRRHRRGPVDERAHAATLAQRLSIRRLRRVHYPVGLGTRPPYPGVFGV